MKRQSGYSFVFLLIILLLAGAIWVSFSTKRDNNYSRDDFQHAAEAGDVASIVIEQNKEVPTGTIHVTTKSFSTYRFSVTDVREIESYARSKGIAIRVDNVPESNWFLMYVLPGLVVLIIFVFFYSMMANNQSGGVSNRMMNFGKSRAQMVTDSKTTFANVAGLREEKDDLDEVVDFLKDPGKYTEMGARIPKGILLEGMPGTGKTLLAKAIAGEAKVPFFFISGSDFVEMFVGVGASRVRDLFADAKKNSPCIVFIDEIDAVARRRGAGMGGGHDEREQTLNQLLVEMDGFEENEGIIVMAATNRVDILDPAILRPGRFDRKITVSAPDVQGREAILKLHAEKKHLGDDVDLKELARTTAGFTGADLENLLNEAAIKAAREKRAYINDEDVRKSFIKVGIGTEKRSHLITERDRKITAYHESGHAILMHLLPLTGSVYTVSVIPTGEGAAGYMMPVPDNDDQHQTKEQLRQRLMVTLGGRVAEEIIFGDVSTGASSDIKKATKVARSMVTRFGMSPLGLICYEDDDNEVFIGRDLAHAKTTSEAKAAEIDEEVKHIIDGCYQEAKRILEENLQILHNCAALLIEKERIGREEFEALFEAKTA
ncbi:MAG: ATP-dependent zinc metalloprotease FtsH [Lachnospiraceae bacterium]|nr:ATP-dependent zinc metalloprotease FtsH [Lachnospiraceae bacterium]